MNIATLLDETAKTRSTAPAIEDSRGKITSYAELTARASRVAEVLLARGASEGDRVGMLLPRSAEAVASIQGILRLGGVCVPGNIEAPVARNAQVFRDCEASFILASRDQAEPLREALKKTHSEAQVMEWDDDCFFQTATATTLCARNSSAPAILLYTSGSMGNPKGVVLTHGGLFQIVRWYSQALPLSSSDRILAHAAFQFAVSVYPLFMAIQSGGTLVLLDESSRKHPDALADFLCKRRISVWSSSPSVLNFMMRSSLSVTGNYPDLRAVILAGEAFRPEALKKVRSILDRTALINHYASTETGPCTFQLLGDDPSVVGKPSFGVEVKLVEEEMCIRSPSLTPGYWNSSQLNEKTFRKDDLGERWFYSGDLGEATADGGFRYRGRRDRMIKKRGYRVELAEIDARLSAHPLVTEAATIARNRENDDDPLVVTYYATRDGIRLSSISLKAFCSEALPVYMVPDEFILSVALPRTSTGKVAFRELT